MTRYRYNRQVTPPAPFVYVTVRLPGAEGPGVNYPAQIDTGASRSIIPGQLVEELGLTSVRQTQVMGFGGHVSPVPTYLIEIGVRELPLQLIEVIGSTGEPFCLLGRDLLNGFRLILDGPKLMVEIE